ncbi:MAG TPA: CpsD/CapB family tyrosine-protein kinase, partial [Jiangellaceae bacterium]
ANLAAALAEIGRTVIVIDCDFRKPEAHLFLGALAGRGLTDAIEDGFDGDFDHVIEHTSISGVRLITSGRPVNQPASVIPRLAGVIAEARQRADVVLIDSSPLLVVSEAVDVLPYADAAVVTCRLRRTTHEQARRSRLVLQRAEVPVLGVVLTGTEPVRGTAYGRPTRLQAFRSLLREWASSNQSRRVFSSTRTAPTATEDPAASQTHPVVPAWDEPVEERQPERHQEDWRLDWEDRWKDQTEDQEVQEDQQADDQQATSPPPPERRYHRRHEQVGESLEKQHNGEADNRPVELHYNRWHGSSPMQESPEGESADDASEAEQEQAFRSAG